MAHSRTAQLSGVALSLMCVASCSGGGSTPVAGIQPVQPSPQPTTPSVPTEVVAFENFAASPSNATIGAADGQGDQMVVISEGATGDGKLSVTIGAQNFVLDGAVSNGKPVFTSRQPGANVSVAQTDKESSAVLAIVGHGAANPNDRTGYSVLGSLTDQSELDDLQTNGVMATYAGSSHLVATRSDGARDRADGTVTLTVDFNGGPGSVTGNLDLISGEVSSGTHFEIDAVNMVLSNGDIVAGGIIADLDVMGPSNFSDLSNQLGMEPGGQGLGTAAPGKLVGKFYGTNAQNAGGTFEFQGTNVYVLDSQRLDIVVKGGFLGKLQPPAGGAPATQP